MLRPQGRLALAAWDDPSANPWISVMAQAIRRAVGAPEPDPELPGMFAFAPPGRLERLLEGAGFTDLRIEPLALDRPFDSFEHWWGMQLDLAKPLADLIESQAPEQRERIREAVRDAAAPFADADGSLSFSARALMASASA